MATIAELEAGLVNADAAGDVDAARTFAAEITRMRSAAQQPAEQKDDGLTSYQKAAREEGRSAAHGLVMAVPNAVAGAVRGAAGIGTTLRYPLDKIDDMIWSDGRNRNQERRKALDPGLEAMGAEPDSFAYGAGKLGAEIAGTSGAGGVLGAAVKAVSQSPRALALARALETGGFQAGATPGAANMATRVAGGTVTGGTSAGLINPEDADVGAMVGAALPPGLSIAGKLGSAIGRTISGPAVPTSVQQGVQAAREAGYVVPPSQAKPTLLNRVLEGFAGKASTAQNASARNQPVTNDLAKKAIGAADLSEAGIAQVRNQANAAYDALGAVGAFKSDEAFAIALDKAGASTAAMRKNFPELVNNEVDTLINGLKSRGQFEAQPTVEAIKQFRASAYANKASADPAKKELGRAQNKISNALEDLIDRNLQEAGNRELLANYRAARQTLAKVYDVEKATNKASGNVDAVKLANALQKGRELTGELRQIAEFAGQFPKAAQTVERMGSLPQVSPLDFGALGTLSAVTSNPALMAGVLARPAARAAVLSGPVQNRLAKPATRNELLARLLANQDAGSLLYRAGPVLATDR